MQTTPSNPIQPPVGQQLHPAPKQGRGSPNRRWRVDYDLAYDYGGSGKWSGYYHTRLLARIAAFWNTYVGSWGGTAVLFDQGVDKTRR